MIDDPGLTFPRYCEHGKLCDDQCDDCDKLQDEESDPAPYCSYGHRTKEQCDCGPIADND